jgi:hypothetical protein
MTDMINPAHYHGDRKFKPIAVIEDWGLNYRLGNAVKYISRNGRKPGEDPREGLKKAVWYLTREIESYEKPKSDYAVTYEDVLQDHAACASEGHDLRLALDDQHTLWDDSLGPMEPPQVDYLGGAEWDASYEVSQQYKRETDEAQADMMRKFCDFDVDELHKNLDQFESDEIVSTFERRGLIFGVDKQGRTYILGAD